MKVVIPKRAHPRQNEVRQAMKWRIRRRMRFQRSISRLRLREQSNAALQHSAVTKRVGRDLRLYSRISPAHRLFTPRAIDERIEQAVALRLASHAPDR